MNPQSPSGAARILLVDDDPQGLESNRKILELARYEVVTARDGQEALELVRPPAGDELAQRFDAIVTDVRMPRLGGLDFLKAFSLCGHDTPVILMTAFGSVEDAVWAMKLGAVDFLTKPFKRQALLTAVESAIERARARTREVHVPKAASTGPTLSSAFDAPLGDLFGDSEAMRELRSLIAQVAPTAATVCLSGESGSGKELVARNRHTQSTRSQARFIAINCAAVPEQLIESELFGYEKGAFTGAHQARAGLFEAAHGGTLLLDEIGDMPLALQAKLLRTLQEGEIRRVGSTSSRRVDVRVIAATHRDLRESVRQGRFREDLLFRLEVISIHVPSLRERSADIPGLARLFLRTACARHGRDVQRISADALRILQGHVWPGNVRELSNVMERAVVFAQAGQVEVQDLPPHLIELAGAPVWGKSSGSSSMISVKLGTPLKDVEDLLIRKTLEATAGDKHMAAKLLGINQRTIYRKLEPDHKLETKIEKKLD